MFVLPFHIFNVLKSLVFGSDSAEHEVNFVAQDDCHGTVDFATLDGSIS